MVSGEDAELDDASTLHVLTVPAGAPALRLDRWLADVLPKLSRARIQKLLEDGLVTVAGEPASQSLKIKPGLVVELVEPAPVSVELLAQDIPLSVLFEDQHLVVINKAPGMVVHPAAGNPDGTLVNALLHHIQDLRPVSGELRPGIVHRLDKDTSGVIIVAKGDESLRALQASFKERHAVKRYVALCRGVVTPEKGTFRTRFGRHPTQRLKFTGKAGPREAVTDWRVLAQSQGCTAVELTLHTGRTHQIRVHLSEAGHPVLGDVLYGGKKAAQEAPRQLLHAAFLALPHPLTRKITEFRAPIPADMLDVATRLGLERAFVLI